MLIMGDGIFNKIKKWITEEEEDKKKKNMKSMKKDEEIENLIYRKQ